MIQARVIADSISDSDIRIVTLEAEYPRFIHSQFMTHRVFSRSASSSRARPIESVIEEAESNPVLPLVWGRNQRGMQAKEIFASEDVPALNAAWLSARDAAINHAKRLNAMGVHKQIVNRILEPFTHIKVVITATEWDNFFNLRRHDDAQPEIKHLADSMWNAIYSSWPVRRRDWHLPYVLDEEREKWPEDACIMFSVARCARVSYMTHGANAIDHERDHKLHDMLLRDGHMSPFEHQARPNMIGDDVRSSNFAGWQQYRKMIPGEAIFQKKH
jgi:thymidylate synthase ThyX